MTKLDRPTDIELLCTTLGRRKTKVAYRTLKQNPIHKQAGPSGARLISRSPLYLRSMEPGLFDVYLKGVGDADNDAMKLGTIPNDFGWIGGRYPEPSAVLKSAAVVRTGLFRKQLKLVLTVVFPQSTNNEGLQKAVGNRADATRIDVTSDLESKIAELEQDLKLCRQEVLGLVDHIIGAMENGFTDQSVEQIRNALIAFSDASPFEHRRLY